MDAKRLRLALFGLLGVSVVLFLFISSWGLSKLGTKSQTMVDLKLKSATVDSQLTNLAVAKNQIEQYGYFKQVAKTVIPSDKDQAQAVLDIFQIANQTGIAIGTITFPASNLGASSSSATSAVSASAKSVLSQAKPVTGISGLYSIELTVAPQTGDKVLPEKQVTYAKMLDFLDRLERNRRTAQITQVNVQPLTSENSPLQYISFTLTLNIFIKP